MAVLAIYFVTLKPKPTPSVDPRITEIKLENEQIKHRLALMASLLNENMAVVQYGGDDFVYHSSEPKAPTS